MEQSSSSSSISFRRKDDPPEQQQQPAADHFNLREWGFKARISRENTMSRRFSASYIRSFREDHTAARSFRSNFTISSTASSPGYPLKDEIDPSTYSFTTALKALQARSVYSWECMSPDGFALNSKWYEAEKYISNPLSGEVPMECLSAKTLSGRSFRHLTSRITMSAPLIYPSHHTRQMPHTTTTTTTIKSSIAAAHDEDLVHFPIQEKKMEGMMTRDVGTQSTPHDISRSSSPSPSSTPSIKERSLNRCERPEAEDSPSNSNTKLKSEEQQQVEVVVKETREKEETKREREEMRKKVDDQGCRCKMQGGCLSLTSLWTRRRQREKHKPRKNTPPPPPTTTTTKTIFLHYIKGC